MARVRFPAWKPYEFLKLALSLPVVYDDYPLLFLSSREIDRLWRDKLLMQAGMKGILCINLIYLR